jgi:N-methylhydantoinase A/oxoprolinase/acetone carboxylase beta subunit
MAEYIKIGLDTGGTFTDFVIYSNGEVYIKKIPSTPKNPSAAVLKGLEEYINTDKEISIVHGSTVATNALLERKGAKIALITTAGFEDVIFIGRQTRSNLFSLSGEVRAHLLPRRACFGISERTTHTGKIEKDINPIELNSLMNKILNEKVNVVVVSLINSYANPNNEKQISRKLKEKKIQYTLSTDLLPEYREYERTITTAINGYLIPVMDSYICDLEKKLRNCDLKIMQSNEGYISPKLARKEPIRTALSGPAGGVVGALHVARSAGFKKIVSFDMGGTSTDVSLVDAAIRRTAETEIGGFPIRIPIIDIHTVGAGGGSIAHLDKGGALRVGPQSAGADPGPACYGKGNQATVTDANLVLGRLDPDYFLGGTMKIDPKRSKEAIEKIAATIGKRLIETAEGIIEIANVNMEKAVRVISIERGVDPRGFYLFSFGGAGGMHAVELAERLRMSGVIIPKNAGVLSAQGLLLTNSIKDYSKSLLKITDKIDPGELEKHFKELEKKGVNDMKVDRFEEGNIELYRSLDLRYAGQSYEITIPYTEKQNEQFPFVSDFHSEHKKQYTYNHPDTPIEIVNVRLRAIGKTDKVKLNKHKSIGREIKNAFIKKQKIYYRKKEIEASIYKRELLDPGITIKKPSLIIDYESTTFLPPGYNLKVDEYLNLIIGKGAEN